MHPAQAEAYATAWRDKETREDVRNGMLRYTIAQSASSKRLKVADFLPAHCKPKKQTESPEIIEAKFKAAMIALSARAKAKQ